MTVVVKIQVEEGQPGGVRCFNMDDGVNSSHVDIMSGESVTLYVSKDHELLLEKLTIE